MWWAYLLLLSILPMHTQLHANLLATTTDQDPAVIAATNQAKVIETMATDKAAAVAQIGTLSSPSCSRCSSVLAKRKTRYIG